MQNPVFELWVAAGGSGTPPMHSNVFVCVFGMRLEFSHAPMTSAAEFQKIIGKPVVAGLSEDSALHGASYFKQTP